MPSFECVACRSQAPEVGNFTDQQLNTALCDAAKRTGGVEPIDVCGPSPRERRRLVAKFKILNQHDVRELICDLFD